MPTLCFVNRGLVFVLCRVFNQWEFGGKKDKTDFFWGGGSNVFISGRVGICKDAKMTK